MLNLLVNHIAFELLDRVVVEVFIMDEIDFAASAFLD